MTSLRILWKVVVMAVAVAVAFTPPQLLACAACTGRTDSPLAVGMNWGILTLLGFVVSVLSCFVVFFVHIVRRTPPTDDEGNPPLPG